MKKINIQDIKTYKACKKNHSDYTYGGWYMIENIVTKKKYIGKSIEYMHRLRQHISIKNPKIQIDKEINKYGLYNFNYYLIKDYSSENINFFNRKLEITIENSLIKKHKTMNPYGYNKVYYERI